MSLHELVPARRLLARTTLAEYLASRPASPPPVVLDEKMSIGDALNTLAKHGILSAPLVNRASMSYEGFIDGADIVRNLLRRIDRDLLTSYTHMAQDKKREFIAALLPAFLKRSALAMRREGGGDGELIYKSYGSLSLLATVTDGFLEAGRLPTSTLGVAHRVAVFDYDTEGDAMRITSILSQSDVMRYLHAHAGELGALGGHTLAELGLCPKEVLRAESQLSVLEGFDALIRARASSLVVVSREGGEADLRFAAGVGLDEMLPADLESFVAKRRSYLLRAAPSTTLADVLAMLGGSATRGAHHVVVVGADGRPCAVVTATDILRLICTDPPAAGSGAGA